MPGYDANVDEPTDWTEIIVRQDRGPDDVWEHYDWTLFKDVICDGTRYTVVRRFAPRSPEGRMDPALPVHVRAGIGAALDAQTSWPH
jgi:hypothetical protein